MMKIYLSSTYEDLKDHRRVVFDALRKSGYQVIAMEDYVATDTRPVDKCLADVEKSEKYNYQDTLQVFSRTESHFKEIQLHETFSVLILAQNNSRASMISISPAAKRYQLYEAGINPDMTF